MAHERRAFPARPPGLRLFGIAAMPPSAGRHTSPTGARVGTRRRTGASAPSSSLACARQLTPHPRNILRRNRKSDLVAWPEVTALSQHHC